MVIDRTIVVESVAAGGSAPLDEGSLLVIRVQNDDNDKETSRLMPMGKIFEVFGPVSRPLYTIRLPSAKDKPAKKAEKMGTECVERDVDEISLHDDESEEQYKNDETEEHEKSKESEPIDGSASMDGESRVLNTTSSVRNAEVNEKNDSHEDDDTDSDPWSIKGKYTELLQSTIGIPVYYIPDITKLLDTGAVIRNSGRGCGELLSCCRLYFLCSC